MSRSNDAHDRARQLIVLAGPEALSQADQTWLTTHVETWRLVPRLHRERRETIHALRGIPIAAERSLVSTTQMTVRRRALELQRQRERLWLVSISCIAVTLFAALTTAAMWRVLGGSANARSWRLRSGKLRSWFSA